MLDPDRSWWGPANHVRTVKRAPLHATEMSGGASSAPAYPVCPTASCKLSTGRNHLLNLTRSNPLLINQSDNQRVPKEVPITCPHVTGINSADGHVFPIERIVTAASDARLALLLVMRRCTPFFQCVAIRREILLFSVYWCYVHSVIYYLNKHLNASI